MPTNSGDTYGGREMTAFNMGSRMCNFCRRNVPSPDACGCEGERRSHLRETDRLIAKGATSTVESLRKRIEWLEGALAPFATAAEDIDERTRGDSNMWEHPASMNVYASDFRDARAALADSPPERKR